MNLKFNHFVFVILFTLIGCNQLFAQKVGLVLSGGGAKGLAHIGLIMALEENDIPIDYISGTSAGALVGAMYACGYSPAQMRDYVLDEVFQKMTSGELKDENQFILKRGEHDASILNVPFAKDSIFQKSLPTNFITPALLDFEMLKLFGLVSESVQNNFDDLFIPFRCVASDITKKEARVFRNGKLNAAVRASMTYPFYINPITIDNVLYFDGGLYDNFPVGVMKNDFNPDFIIGCNVSNNASAPREDDLISQITNMLVVPTDFSIEGSKGVMISPQLSVETFDFDKVLETVEAGYIEGLKYVDSIKQFVDRRVTKTDLIELRNAFKSNIGKLQIEQVVAKNRYGKEAPFINESILNDNKSEILSEHELQKRYFRAYASPQVKYLYPTLEPYSDSTLQLNLDVTKQKTFMFGAGGHFSSRPVNTGYLKLSYLGLGNSGIKLTGESYFGKFYGSTRLYANIDIPSTKPFRVTPYFTLNRWDYFRSFTTFFEQVKPSFLVQNELYYGLRMDFPLGNSWKYSFDFRNLEINDEYYQTQDFTNIDTADITYFKGQTAVFGIEKNTLNRKQWASKGAKYKLQFRYVQGREQSLSGSTSNRDYDMRRYHQWINLNLEAQKFYNLNKFFSVGLNANGVFNSQTLFANYTATILTMTAFEPIPDSKTFFLEEYRAPHYGSAGINAILHVNSFLDLRLDTYFFQPFRRIERIGLDDFEFSDDFKIGSIMAGASLIFHSPLGPFRFSANYFPEQSQPTSFQLSYGYVIFNKRAIRD